MQYIRNTPVSINMGAVVFWIFSLLLYETKSQTCSTQGGRIFEPSCPTNQVYSGNINLASQPEFKITQVLRVPDVPVTPCINTVKPCSNLNQPYVNPSRVQQTLSIPQLAPNGLVPEVTPIVNIPQVGPSCGALPQVTPFVNIPQVGPNCGALPQVTPFVNIPQVGPSCGALPQVGPNLVNIPQLNPRLPQLSTKSPQVVTVIDNTLANSLANAIQLLLLNNLIDSTTCLPNTCSTFDNSYSNFEVLTTDVCPQVCEPIEICETVCLQEPQPPTPPCDVGYPNLGPAFPILDGFDRSCPASVLLESLLSSCKGGNLNPISCVSQAPTPILQFAGPLPVQTLQLAPTFTSLPCVGQTQTILPAISSNIGPTQSTVILQPGPVPAEINVPPMAVEVPFPGCIPAQLVCNFAYLPNNTPCVNVNVETLPFDNSVNSYSYAI